MNRIYNTVAGCHTPEQTAEVLRRLRAEFPNLIFLDQAWHNDAADRIEVKGTKEKDEVSIWVPNPGENDTFGITFRNDQGEDDAERARDFTDFEEMAQALKALGEGFTPLVALLDSSVNAIFKTAQDERGITSGDISPLMEKRMERAVKELARVMEQVLEKQK